MSTETLSDNDRAETPGQCWDCAGPCVAYAGTIHGWRCRTCLNAYVDRSAAAFDDLDADQRRKVMAVHSTSNSIDGDAQRDGGGLVMDRAAITPGTGATS